MRTRHRRPPCPCPAGLVAGLLVLSLFAALGLAAVPAGAQCLLANPSFEVGGGGVAAGGWNQFGPVGAVADAVHGAVAARVTGPDAGGWDVAAFWQRLDSEPGEQWEITGWVRQSVDAPLAGAAAALVNVEWRDAGGGLIGYQSVPVAVAGDPAGDWRAFDLLGDPAPAGTVAIHLLLGVLQGPGDPVPEVHFDQITAHGSSGPGLDELQWADFPGGRTVDFAGRTWRVKGPGYYGPGPNVFCHTPDCVWVDPDGALHLTLASRAGVWASTEVVLADALGYGDYVVSTRGRLDLLDPQAVIGIFLWQYGPCWDEAFLWWNPYNEVDIEYSRWGEPGDEIGQFVAQPWDYPGNRERFDAAFAPGEVTSHAMRWLPDRVEYRAWRGGPQDESPATLIHAWTYEGPHLPRPEQPRLHLNLWKLAGTPAADQEVVFTDFRFVPAGSVTAAPQDPPTVRGAGGRLRPAAPNPFNPRTVLAFELRRAGPVQLVIRDLAGRHVRTLVDGRRAEGLHRVAWDGRDGAGRTVASGTYLVSLQGRGFMEARRVTLIK